MILYLTQKDFGAEQSENRQSGLEDLPTPELFPLSHLFKLIQGDPSRSSKPVLDINVKVAF